MAGKYFEDEYLPFILLVSKEAEDTLLLPSDTPLATANILSSVGELVCD